MKKESEKKERDKPKEIKEQPDKSTSGASASVTKKAWELVKNFLSKPFKIRTETKKFQEDFGAKEYLDTYYESIDVEKILEAHEIIQNIFKHTDTVNLREITDANGKTIVGEGALSIEAAENVCIFDFQKIVSRRLMEEFPEDNIKVLDVGGGPTIYQHIAASLTAGRITHSEFLGQNRDEVLKWLNNEKGSHNWDDYFRVIKTIMFKDQSLKETIEQQLKSENPIIRKHAEQTKTLLTSDDVEVFKKYLREVIQKDVVYADVFRQDLGMESKDKYELVNSVSRESSVELLTSNFTIESATADRSKWQDGMVNIMNKVAPNGFIALTAIREASWYQVGNEKLPAVEVNENDLKEIFEANKFKVIERRTILGSDKETTGYNGMVFIFAQKI